MTAMAEKTNPTKLLEQDVIRLRQELSDRGVAAAYARLYGPLAAVSVVLAFLPLLEEEYGTLWAMAARPAGGPAALGIMLMLGLVGCLVFATIRPAATAGLPVAIVVLAAVIVLMLVTKPGTGEPTPGLTPEGHAAMAVAVLTGLLGVAHAIQLRSRRRGVAHGPYDGGRDFPR